VAQFHIGGTDKGYDYLHVDPQARRVYVAHGDRVEVLDADTGARLGEIAGMHGVHGIEIIPTLGKGYTTDGLDRAVTVFEAKSLRILHRIKYTGVKPDAIGYDPNTRLIYVVNGGETGDLTIIDPVRDAIVDTVGVDGGKLEGIAFDGRGRAFVADEDKSVIHVVDTKTRRALAAWPLTPCEGPTGMAIDRAHHRIFAACGNERLAIVDSDDGKIVATPRIGPEPDGAAFSVATQQVFTSNRDGTLSVVHEISPNRYLAEPTIATASGARTIALDSSTGRIFLPSARFGEAPATGGRAPMVPDSFGVVVIGH